MTEKAQARTACADTPGRVTPVIDRGRCEAKAACVAACPFDVFEIRALSPEEFADLPLLGKLKAWAHGKRQAFAVRADACHACGACVKACPEGAIRLTAIRGV
jgi:NAD-dependent dihydropyrimidine dehydrogenase PreA subunit